MQAQESLVGVLESYLQPLVDMLGIDWITLTLALEALILLIIFLLIRIFSGRGSIKVKLSAPMLAERSGSISGENLAGLKALLISTSAAMHTLEALQSRREIGPGTFAQLSARYKEQLTKIEGKLTEEMDTAEKSRLRQLYDESLRPTAAVTPSEAVSEAPGEAPTPPGTPSAPSPPSGPPSGPPAAPSAPSGPPAAPSAPSGPPAAPSTPSGPPSGPPAAPSAPSGPPSGPPTAPSAAPAGDEGELPARSTSIAALRNEMLKELKRLRELLKTE